MTKILRAVLRTTGMNGLKNCDGVKQMQLSFKSMILQEIFNVSCLVWASAVCLPACFYNRLIVLLIF